MSSSVRNNEIIHWELGLLNYITDTLLQNRSDSSDADELEINLKVPDFYNSIIR